MVNGYTVTFSSKEVERRIEQIEMRLGLFMAHALEDSYYQNIHPALLAYIRIQRLPYTGNLERNIRYNHLMINNRLIIGEFGAFVPYAGDLELGTGPQSSSEVLSQYPKLLRWIRLKKEPGVDFERAKEIAFLIMRKFRSEGSDPHPFLFPVYMKFGEQYANAAVHKFWYNLVFFTRTFR